MSLLTSLRTQCYDLASVGSYEERTNFSNASNNSGALDRCTALPSRATRPNPSP